MIFNGCIVGLLVPCSIWILQVLHSVAPATKAGERIALINGNPVRSERM
jgi:hypothetical protein